MTKRLSFFSNIGRVWHHGFITMLAFAYSGCGITPRTEVPLPYISQATTASKSKTLVVMLPGRGDRARHFQNAGFLERIAGRDFDAVAVDAHLGYYRERILIRRLHEDVILPAKANGYERILLLGVSMGGLGSVLYAERHPDMIDGLILLAPYLGDSGIAADVTAAGGLDSWSGEGTNFPDHEIAAWEWLRDSRAKENPLPIYLGYGTSDHFASNYGALEQKIRGLTVYTEDGGHKWTTWSPLWSRISAELPIHD